jgi:hypothetical protein
MGINTEKVLNLHKNALKTINGHMIEAGWFETARYRAVGGKDQSNVGLSVAQVARWNEYGTTRSVTITGEDGKPKETRVEHVPARPFMRFAMALFNRDKTDLQRKIAKNIMDGKISPMQGLAQIGLAMEGKIVMSIKTGPWSRNAPSTVAAKGFDSPLRDTGQMFKTVSSKVS